MPKTKRAKTRTERTVQLKVLLSEQEKAQLEQLASERDVTISDLIRRWIRREAELT